MTERSGQTKNPADTTVVGSALDYLSPSISHGEPFCSTASLVSELTDLFSGLVVSNPVNPTPQSLQMEDSATPNVETHYRREPSVATPEPYGGEPGECRPFLMQCSLVFDQQPLSYPTERSRVAYLINLLRGRARRWASAHWDSNHRCLRTYDDFTQELRRVFDKSTRQTLAARRLHSLRQGSHSVADFSIEFRTLAAECGWEDHSALQMVFYAGLNDSIKDGLVDREDPKDLDSLINLSIKIDERHRERRKEKYPHPAPASRSSPPRSFRPAMTSPRTPLREPHREDDTEPMQLGRARLSAEERSRRFQNGCCLYCGSGSHYIAICPSRPKDRARR